MLHLYQSYPEILTFDGTYNLVNTESTIFILNIIDGNNCTRPILIFSTLDESAYSLYLFFEFFSKKTNLSKTVIVMTDKDLTKRKVLKIFFNENVSFRICIFHIMQTFIHKINSIFSIKKNKNKCIISKNEHERNFQINNIRKLINSKNNDDYNLYKSKIHKNLINYYNKNWESIKLEVVLFFYPNNIDLTLRTNNRCEGINSAIKRKIKKKN